MKKSLNILLAAMLLLLAIPTAKAQQQISNAEAQNLLNRMLGQWQVNYSEWSPEQKNFQHTKGIASFRTAYKDNYVREEFEITDKDGEAIKGEGFVRYSNEFNRFELVQLDESGQSTLLLEGKWYPEYRLVSFTPVEDQLQAKSLRMRWDYIFFEDGTFKKVLRKANKKGEYRIASDFHYIPNQTATK